MTGKESFFYNDRENIDTIHDLILRSYQKFPEKIFCKFLADGEIKEKTYADMYHAAVAIGSDINKSHLTKKHAALLGNSSFEWFSSYLGMLYCGIVAVPVDRLLSKEDILKQIDFSDSEVLLYDNNFKDIAEYIKANSICCKRFINFNQAGDDDYFWDIVNSHDDVIEQTEINPGQLAEIVFTSGTTGTSKGVMLSHENLASTVMFGTRLADLQPGETVLSVMPNNHTYELTCGIMTPMYFGMAIAINDNIGRLISNFKIFKPSIILVVPALLKIVQKEIRNKIKKQKKNISFTAAIGLKKLFDILHIDISKKLFSKIHEVFGGQLRAIICGGSFLKEELIKFYHSIGINIIQGYGITECSPLISCNSARYSKSKTVGKVGPYCTVRCVDGELWVKGKNVMLGYYKNPELTAEVIEDGWYKTGDMGVLDEDNFIKLIGRKKNLIILSNGENVCPEELENLLDDIEIIENVVVYEKDEQIAAEIYPKEAYINENNITDIYNAVNREILKINTKLPAYKQIQIVKIRSEPFNKTTTLKIKRDN